VLGTAVGPTPVVGGFQQKHESERRERDAQVRLLLRKVIECAQEALQVLKEPSGSHGEG
jgi:hypothetical protein